MPSRLGLHCHRAGPDIDAAIRACNWAAVKALGTCEPLVTARDQGIPIRILRQYGVESLSPQDAANRFLATAHLDAATEVQLVCEDAKGYDLAWQRAVMAAMGAGGYRGGYLAGGYATGTPEQIRQGVHPGPHFPQLMGLAGNWPFGSIALDEYVGCCSDDPLWAQWLPWTGTRHGVLSECLVHHPVTLPTYVITESGIDNVIPNVGGGGWLARGVSADRYVQTLIALDQLDQRRPDVLARCIFTLGATPDWAGFEIAGIISQLAAYVNSQKGPTVTISGIDVSSNNGPVDWAQVAASGRQFAWSKATEGTGYISPPFAADWPAMRAAGLVRGAYAYARPDLGNDPTAEADYFLAAIPDIQPGDLLALDIEEGNGDYGAWAGAWLDHVQARAGFRPLLYSYAGFLQACNLTAASTGYPWLWLAAYQPNPPALPPGWPEITLWQHTQGATVPGVNGGVDESFSDLTIEQLRTMGKPKEVPVPSPTDAATQAAQRWAALGQGGNPTTALFKAYLARFNAWQASGKANTLDPTPCIHGETTVNGHVYAMFDCGEIYDYHQADGQVYIAEWKDHAAIMQACNWR